MSREITIAKVESFKRGLLKEALEQCTEDQQAFFHRIFPKGVPEKDITGLITSLHFQEERRRSHFDIEYNAV